MKNKSTWKHIFLHDDAVCAHMLSFFLLTLTTGKNLHVQSAAATLQVTTVTRSHFDQIGSTFCFALRSNVCVKANQQGRGYLNHQERLKINENAEQAKPFKPPSWRCDCGEEAGTSPSDCVHCRERFGSAQLRARRSSLARSQLLSKHTRCRKKKRKKIR